MRHSESLEDRRVQRSVRAPAPRHTLQATTEKSRDNWADHEVFIGTCVLAPAIEGGQRIEELTWVAEVHQLVHPVESLRRREAIHEVHVRRGDRGGPADAELTEHRDPLRAADQGLEEVHDPDEVHRLLGPGRGERLEHLFCMVFIHGNAHGAAGF